jgi:catechol 2,3-dioxygenase-like lactoylglutathione lyase family enzyme
MHTLRIDHVVVATPDDQAAAATFQSHFGLPAAPELAGSPTLQIGGARLAFVTPAPGTTLAAALARGGEGLAMVCLEVASLDEAAASLRTAGVAFTTEGATTGRTIAIDPAAAHGVRLTLVEGARR